VINPNDLDRYLTGEWGEQSVAPDPEPDEPDFVVTHSCGHEISYWQGDEPDAALPCSTCHPCPGCGQKIHLLRTRNSI
jgi:hypothetical protein